MWTESKQVPQLETNNGICAGQELQIVLLLRKFLKRKIFFSDRNSLNQLHIVSKILSHFHIFSVWNESALAQLVEQQVSDRNNADFR